MGMREQFDNKLVDRIRELLDYEEAYQEGAWENFLAKRNKKKRRILYWYLRGTAALVIVLLALGPLLERGSSTGTFETDPVGHGERPVPKQERMPSESERNDINAWPSDWMTQGLEEQGPVQKRDGGPEMEVGSPVETNERREGNYVDGNPIPPKGKTGAMSVAQPGEGTTELAQRSPTQDDGFRHEKDRSFGESPLGTALGSNDSNAKESKISGDPTGIVPEPQLDSEREQRAIAGRLDDLEVDATDGPVDKVRLGILLAPGIGSGSGDDRALASSGLGVGLEVTVPISGSDFSLATGTVYNSFGFSRKYGTMDEFSDTPQETYNQDESRIHAVEVPLHLVYRVSDKIYLQTGVSSYTVFKERTERTQTFEREIEVFQNVDGEMVRYTTTESVSIKETIDVKNIRFAPLGTINLSIGYKGPLSPDLNYVIQPFYKYPLKSLSVQDSKTHTVGVTLKIMLID